MNYNLKELERKIIQCQNKNIENINLKEIDDIDKIKVDTNKKGFERIIDFLNNCKNPYAFVVNGLKVKIQFSDDSNISAEDCIYRALKNEYIK